MKSNIYKLLILTGLILLNAGLIAQGPPSPPGENGSGNDQTTGGGATLGSGIEILMIMGLTYGSKKTYQKVKSNLVNQNKSKSRSTLDEQD